MPPGRRSGRVLGSLARHLQRSALAAAPTPTPPAAGTLSPPASLQSDGSLDAESLRRFDEEGYLVFPGFLAPDHTSQLIADMEQLPLLGEGPSRGSGPMCCLGFGLDGLGGLPTHPPTVALVSSVMGGRRFAMRHINAHLQSEGEAGNTWHHDYPCGPPSDPYTTDHGLLNLDRKMCHTLYYPDGISGEIGDLLIMPRSHKIVLPADDVLASLFPDAPDLPGSITIDALPRGSMILAHSSLFHARRARSSSGSARRSLISVAYNQYCERREERFAAHVDNFNPQGPTDAMNHRGVPGHSMAAFTAKALAAGHHRPGPGSCAFLFAYEEAFREVD